MTSREVEAVPKPMTSRLPSPAARRPPPMTSRLPSPAARGLPPRRSSTSTSFLLPPQHPGSKGVTPLKNVSTTPIPTPKSQAAFPSTPLLDRNASPVTRRKGSFGGSGPLFAPPMSNPAECGVQVFCRVRPMNQKERDQNEKFLPKFTPDNEEQISLAGKLYVFDKVFKPDSTQEQVYKGAAYHIVQDVLSGYNGTVFAYGQTSSGKTHTMEGVFGDVGLQGIIPRIVEDIFNHIYNMDAKLEFQIKVSYFEIYNEKIRDLLDITKTNLAIHEDKNRVPYVKGATEQSVNCPEEIMGCIDAGKSNRMVAVTNMNEHSSRSHSVFLISIQQTDTETKKQLTGKLYLVDLAGSEKVSKTGAEGAVLEEAKNINKSLTTLGMVISALADGTKSHVPYRDSKLTRILQESLGGNSRTTVIICASPAMYNEAETKSTLQFGARAKTIKNVVAVNEELSAEEWKRRYERERDKVARLNAQLAAARLEIERWRAGERVPESEWINLAEGAIVAAQAITGNELIPSSSESMLLSMDRSIAAAPPMLTSNNGPISDEDRRKYEEERAKLFQQLDEKDDEIQQHSQKVETLNQQLGDMEDQISTLRAERELCQAEIAAMTRENEASKEETKDVLNALEELAVNYDNKMLEADQKGKENEQLTDDLSKKLQELQETAAEVEALREQLESQKRRVQDTMSTMLKELQEVDNSVKVGEAGENMKDDEMLAHMRICVSKLSSEYKGAKQRMIDLESGSDGTAKQLEANEREMSEMRMHVQQAEAKTQTLQETIDKQEKMKRELEEQIDVLNVRLSSVGGDTTAAATSEEHHKLVSQLRDSIADKSKQVEGLTLTIRGLEAVRDNLQQELDKLRTDEAGKEKKIKELSGLVDKREQAHQDLRGLTETVDKELATLSNLKKMFVANIAAHIKKVPGPDGIDEDFSGSPAQKQKIAFLENNLDQLTRVHKQLVRDNADLRLELPKLEKRLKTTTDRVKSLEQFALASWTRRAKELSAKELQIAVQLGLLAPVIPMSTSGKLGNYGEWKEEEEDDREEEEKERDNDLRNGNVVVMDHAIGKEISAATVAATMAERVGQRRVFSMAMLQALRESKENGMRDRKKYQSEVERIKEAVRQRNLARKGISPQIVKTIRPGQLYSPSATVVAPSPTAPIVRPANAGQMNAQ